MTISRRFFIKSTTSAAFTVALGLLPYRSGAGALPQTNTVSAYIDNLIPKDEFPGAIDLGADDFILHKSTADPLYGKTLDLGTSWLNKVAQKFNHQTFSSLPRTIQLKIMAYAEQQPIATLPHLFHHTLRDDVFSYYYFHPEIIAHFSYAGPPQPVGFPDFADPPKAKTR